MAVSDNIGPKECYLLMENLDDSVTVKDLKDHFAQECGRGTGAPNIRLFAGIPEPSVLRTRQVIRGKEVKVKRYTLAAPTVQEYSQEDWDKLLILSNVKNITDSDLTIHFLQTANGGDGTMFTIYRRESFVILKFESAGVVTNILKKSHTLNAAGVQHTLTVRRPLKKVVLSVTDDTTASYYLAPHIFQALSQKFAVQYSSHDDFVRITGPLTEVVKIQAYLADMKTELSLPMQPTSFMSTEMDKLSCSVANSNIRVYSYSLSLVKASVDMVIALVDSNLSGGNVYLEMLRIEGASLEGDIAEYKKSPLPLGKGVYLNARKMPCTGILLFPCSKPSLQDVGQFVIAAVEAANARKFESIALPLIGTVRSKLPARNVTSEVIRALGAAKTGSVLHVHLLDTDSNKLRDMQAVLRQ